MFKAVTFAKLNKNMSDRALERELRRNPHVAAALGFEDIPSHQAFSYFKRERLTVELFDRGLQCIARSPRTRGLDRFRKREHRFRTCRSIRELGKGKQGD
ncbi:MAG: transposase [Candidatus Sigynarchaeota archaeon]